MERYKIDENTLQVIDRFKSNPDLIDYMSQDILIEIGVLKEMVLGPISSQCSNREFSSNCIKKLESVKISNNTYVINTDLYDPTLVKFLGFKCLNLASIPKKILETIKSKG